MYDVVIVGGGAAGLSAALVLGRARRRVALVDAGEPRNARAAGVHGFLTRDGMPPADLLAVGRVEVAGYGVELIEDKVLSAVSESGAAYAAWTEERAQARQRRARDEGRRRVSGVAERTMGTEPGFSVRLAGGQVLEARQLIVTTGLRDEPPDIPGIAELWGGDVIVCPYCHGYEVRDQPLGVVGEGEHGVLKALLVHNWSADVVLFPGTTAPADERLAARGIEVVPGEVTRLVVANDRLAGVEVAGRVVPRRAVFVNPTFVPTDGLLTGLGCAVDDNGLVRVDEVGRTSVLGVWAAGNVVDPLDQVITAAAAGSRAAAMLNSELVLA